MRRADAPRMWVVRYPHHQHASSRSQALVNDVCVPFSQFGLDGDERSAVPNRVHGGPAAGREPHSLLAERYATLRAHSRVELLDRRRLIARVRPRGGCRLFFAFGSNRDSAEPALVLLVRPWVRVRTDREQVTLHDRHVPAGVHPAHPGAPRLRDSPRGPVRGCRGSGQTALVEKLLRRDAAEVHAVHPVPARREPQHVHRLAAQRDEHALGELGRRRDALAEE